MIGASVAVYRRLFVYLKPYLPMLILGGGLAVLVAAMEGAIASLRRPLYLHIQTMPLSFFSDRHSADLMSRIITDVIRLARLSSTVLVMAVREGAVGGGPGAGV